MSTTYTAQAIYGIAVQKSDFVRMINAGRGAMCEDVGITPELGAEWDAFAGGEFDGDVGIGIHYAGSGIWEEPDEDDALIFGRVVASVCDWRPAEKPLPIQQCGDVDAAIERLGFGNRIPGLFLRMEIA